MIVTCNQCTSKYRVNEDKLPQGGGNIQCPGCGNIFFVSPPDNDLPLPDVSTSSERSRPPADVTLSDDPSKPWKLKTNFGLIYDFPDTASLQTWLMAREDLDGYQLSRDGTTFRPLAEVKEVMSPGLRAKLSAAAAGFKPKAKPAPEPLARPRTATGEQPLKKGAAGGGSAAKAGEGDPEARPAQRPRPLQAPPKLTAQPIRVPRPPKRSNTGLVVLTLFVLVLAIAFGLHFSGAVDFGKMTERTPAPAEVAGTTVVVEQPPTAAPVNTTPPPPRFTPPSAKPAQPTPFGHHQHVTLLLEQAEREMRSREYEKAVKTLNSARGIAPDNPEVYKLLERAYSRTGDRDQARQARDMRRSLEQQKTP